MYPGGKGANKALAAPSLNVNVHFVGKRGNDIFGLQSIKTILETNVLRGMSLPAFCQCKTRKNGVKGLDG
jgi:sugar/nucleoside kinase (ribokinase family)